jgi:outer membrane protein assembly factor BamB
MVQLDDIVTDTNTDAFGRGLDAAPSLSPDGQTIYMTAAKRNISAIDATTGGIVWTDNIFSNNASVSPQVPEFIGSAAVTSSNLYVGSCDGNLYCLNATNGHTNWVKNMGAFAAVYATPSIDPLGRILVPTDETEECRNGNPITGLTCLNPTNGATEWFFQPQDLHDNPDDACNFNAGDIDASVAVANNGTSYFLAEGWRLYSVDPTGKLNWFLPMQAGTEPDSSVAIDSFGRILVGCNSEYIYCVNPDGSLEWTLPLGPLSLPFEDFGPMPGSPTIGPDEALYTGTGGASGAFISLDSSGDTNWVVFPSSGNVTLSSPAVGETALYFASTGGEFFALTPSNQAVAWTFTNTAAIISSPLICPDGSVVYGCEDGFLYCFWGSSLPAGTNAPWPTFHQNAQRTGLQPGTNTLATNNGAPFVSNGTNDGAGHFSFDLLGITNGSWTVYTSTNLSNWVVFQTNVTLSGSPATNTITDSSVLGETNRYYQLSNSNGCSRAIGFTRLMIAPGTNLVADQLCQVDDGVMHLNGTFALGMTMNDLNSLFDLSPWASSMGETAVFQWNGNGFNGDTNGDPGGPPTWPGGGNLTMLPGTSVFMFNPTGETYPIWFTGLVRNQQIFSLQTGTNYLSATAPIAGSITNITGYTPHNGDVVKLWNTSTSNFVSHPYMSGSWGTNGVPMLGVGQGFVLVSTIANVWTNNWTTMAP